MATIETVKIFSLFLTIFHPFPISNSLLSTGFKEKGNLTLKNITDVKIRKIERSIRKTGRLKTS